MSDEFALRVWLGAFKAMLISSMALTTMVTFSTSIKLPIAFGAAIFVLACFNTWRRLLEPISLLLFLATAAYLCVDAGLVKQALGQIAPSSFAGLPR